MVIRRESMGSFDTESCHGGEGRLVGIEALADYDRRGPGIRFVHDDTLAPGASIGEHLHEGDEEIYLVLEGRGTMLVDGAPHEIRPGDLCITRSGHTHGLVNSPDSPMRLLVVGASAGEETPR